MKLSKAKIRSREMMAEATIRSRVLIKLKSVNDSMKKSNVRCSNTVRMANRTKGPAAV